MQHSSSGQRSCSVQSAQHACRCPLRLRQRGGGAVGARGRGPRAANGGSSGGGGTPSGGSVAEGPRAAVGGRLKGGGGLRGGRDAGHVRRVDEVNRRSVVGGAARAAGVGGEGVVGEREAVDVEELQGCVVDLPVVLPRVVVLRAAANTPVHSSARIANCMLPAGSCTHWCGVLATATRIPILPYFLLHARPRAQRTGMGEAWDSAC